jgi:hypothetical protein
VLTGFSDWKRTTLALLLFGIAFGYVEAAAAHYLGTVYEPVRKRFYPDSAPSDVFPLLTLKQVQEAGPEYLVLLKTEVGAGICDFIYACCGRTCGKQEHWALAGGVSDRVRYLGYLVPL